MVTWPIHIVVSGKPEPAGSKSAFVIPGTNRASVVDANKNAKPWKRNVAAAAAEQYAGDPIIGPVDVMLVFVLARLKGHYGTGRNATILKESAPLQPTVAPDVLKLARGVEDALTGLVYMDDAQIVNEVLQKRYGNHPRVEIFVRETALTSVRDLLLLGEDSVAPPIDAFESEQLSLV